MFFRGASQYRASIGLNTLNRRTSGRNTSNSSTAAKVIRRDTFRALHDRVPPSHPKSTAEPVSGRLTPTPTGGESSIGAPGSDQLSMAAKEESVLRFEDGPLVWVDLEMTGLDPNVDKIMEIAVLITNGDLQVVDEGVEAIIHVGKEQLDRMDEWCTRQHGSSGLTVACLKSTNSLEEVSRSVLRYVKAHIPDKRVGVLAGNSVHVDKQFLAAYMPELVDHLHYRIVDVSSIKELCRRWYPGIEAPKASPTRIAHRALGDIQGSIEELQWYRENLFVREKTLPSISSKP